MERSPGTDETDQIKTKSSASGLPMRKRKRMNIIEKKFETNEVVFANKDLNKATNKINALGEKVKSNLFEIAFIIAEVNEKKCFADDGFKNVHEWTTSTFGFKKTQSYTLLKIGKEYTIPVLDEKGKVIGYKSNLLDGEEDFTTTQIEKMLPAGHDKAIELVENETITPDMTAREIGIVIKSELNADTDADTETDTDTDTETETDTDTDTETETKSDFEVYVIDEKGNKYLIPNSVLKVYQVFEF